MSIILKILPKTSIYIQIVIFQFVIYEDPKDYANKKILELLKVLREIHMVIDFCPENWFRVLGIGHGLYSFQPRRYRFYLAWYNLTYYPRFT